MKASLFSARHLQDGEVFEDSPGVIARMRWTSYVYSCQSLFGEGQRPEGAMHAADGAIAECESVLS